MLSSHEQTHVPACCADRGIAVEILSYKGKKGAFAVDTKEKQHFSYVAIFWFYKDGFAPKAGEENHEERWQPYEAIIFSPKIQGFELLLAFIFWE